MAKKPNKAFFVRMAETGNTVRIAAPSAEEALRISDTIDPRTTPIVTMKDPNSSAALLRTPDGKEYIASEGYSSTDPEAIAKFKENPNVQPLIETMQNRGYLQEAERQLPTGRMTGPIIAATQASGFGAGSFTDELAQALFGGDTRKALEAVRVAQQSERPLETFAAQAGVGIAEGAALIAKYPQIAKLFGGAQELSMPARMGRAVATAVPGGAITSGLQSAGEAGAGSRLQEGLKGAIIGGATAGVVSSAAPLVASGARRIADVMKASDVPMIANALGVSRSAAMVIKNAFEQGGNLETAIQNIQRAGRTGMLADAGVAARALTDAAAQSGGAPMQTVQTALEKRADAVSQDMAQTLTRTIGSDKPLSPRAAMEQIASRTKDARSQAYKKAYSVPIDYSSQAGMRIEDVISRVDNKTLREAFEEANADMQADGIRNMQLKINVDDAGNITSMTEQPNVQQLDYLKRAMQTLAENNRDPKTFRFTAKGDRYARLARELRSAVGDAAVDPKTGQRYYDEAVTLGGDKIAEQNAFILGRDALKPQTEIEDVFDTLGDNPSQAQMDAVKLGMVQYIRKLLGDVKAVPSDPDVAARQLDAFYRLTSSDNARQKIAMILGDDAQDMFRQIDEVAQTSIVRAQLAKNSATQVRGSIQRGVEEMTAGGPIQELLQGKPLQAASTIVSEITGQTRNFGEQQRMQIYNEIASALTRSDSKSAIKALQILQDAQNGKVLSSEEISALTNEIAALSAITAQKPAEQRLEGVAK